MNAYIKEIDRLKAEVIKAYDDGFLDAIDSLERLEEEEVSCAIGYLKRVHDELDNEPMSRTRRAEVPMSMRETLNEIKIEEGYHERLSDQADRNIGSGTLPAEKGV